MATSSHAVLPILPEETIASSVPGSEIVGSAELRKLEHVSTNQIKVLRLRLTFFEDFDQSGF